MKRPCLEHRCPGFAVDRVRCLLHKRTEAQRGYGTDWRAVRATVRAEVRACEKCGTTVDLTVDHIVPQSLGGSNARANLRVLCRSCHSSIGVRASGGGSAGPISTIGRRSDTLATLRERYS